MQYIFFLIQKKKTVSKDGNTKNKKNKGKGTAEVLTSIRRYYSNTFTDRIKQDAMNLFLGMYQPQPIQCITALNEFHLEQKTYRELSTQQEHPKSKLKNEGKYSKRRRAMHHVYGKHCI